MIVPKMGRTRPASIAGALLTPVQQRVLALLFGQPDRSFQSGELIRLARSGTGATHRQLARLEGAGLVIVTRSGNQKHYQANRGAPVFDELHGLIVKTVGLVEPLRTALKKYGKRIGAAFVYGSVAKGTEKATSDVDLLVISENLGYADVFEGLQNAEAILGRRVSPTVLTPSSWRSKRLRPDSFAARIAAQPKLFVIGSEDDV